ncbi:hypothetical protein [Desulfuromonas acetoxidans]|uniref:hypothetical protein n=1 Tax=Desulfuromonas acetoxidans TaxID=891 RepID=UPI00292FBDF0|nr:hypothetical protein [Desulfuromonas acetoxidans]
MNSEQSERYITCDRCGKEILEKCAIEENDLTLCGDCVVLETTKEVHAVEKRLREQRKTEYEQTRKEVLKKQHHRTIIVFLLCLLTLSLVLIFNYFNKPQPVKHVDVDISSDLETAESLMHLGIHKFQAAHSGELPGSLKQLIPQFIPQQLQEVLENFSYQKNSDGSYHLELKKTAPAETQK